MEENEQVICNRCKKTEDKCSYNTIAAMACFILIPSGWLVIFFYAVLNDEGFLGFVALFLWPALLIYGLTAITKRICPFEQKKERAKKYGINLNDL